MAVTGQALEFPQSEILLIDVWPEEEGNTVEFRLVYKGRLPAEGRGGGGGRNAENETGAARRRPRTSSVQERER